MRKDRLIAVILGLASLVLYVTTSAPSVATIFDDSLEFQVVLPTLGIAHPSGYPLYTLARQARDPPDPFRDPAGRANLLSAAAAAVAVGLLYLVARRFAGNRLAAALATAVFAISPAWWSQSTIAEVYALHGLLMILFLYLLLRWEESRERVCQDRSLACGRRPGRRPGTGAPSHDRLALPGRPGFRPLERSRPAAPAPALACAACACSSLRCCSTSTCRSGDRAVTSLDGTYQPTLRGTLDWILARGYRVFLTGNPFGVSGGAGDFVALFLDQFGAALRAQRRAGAGDGVALEAAPLRVPAAGHRRHGGIRHRLQGAGHRRVLHPGVHADGDLGRLGPDVPSSTAWPLYGAGIAAGSAHRLPDCPVPASGRFGCWGSTGGSPGSRAAVRTGPAGRAALRRAGPQPAVEHLRVRAGHARTGAGRRPDRGLTGRDDAGALLPRCARAARRTSR